MSEYPDLQERLAELVRQAKQQDDQKTKTQELVAESKQWRDLMTVRAELNASNDPGEICKLARIARALRGDSDLFE